MHGLQMAWPVDPLKFHTAIHSRRAPQIHRLKVLRECFGRTILTRPPFQPSISSRTRLY
jgi:hypothetical protein